MEVLEYILFAVAIVTAGIFMMLAAMYPRLKKEEK